MTTLPRRLRYLAAISPWALLAVVAISMPPSTTTPEAAERFEPTSGPEALVPHMPPTTSGVDGLIQADHATENLGHLQTAVNPWQVTVATAKPEIADPELYQAPNGARVFFADPVTNPTYFGTDLTLLVTAEYPGWLQVQLPVRPNGTTAWVRSDNFTTASHTYHAEVQLGNHRLRVWSGERLIADTATVVGTAATPTPLGRFYVNERLPSTDPSGSYGPWILSLSAHSEVLETFADGRPVIAIHGTNRPDLLGTDASNGCVRIPNDIVELLAELVPLGTPVDIVA